MTQDDTKTAPAAGPSKVCYLHIGPHKTGTTSIQNALFTNADRLAEIGLHYPTLTAERGDGKQRRNHTPLGRPSVYRARYLRNAPFWSELSQKIRQIDGSIIVSTEHFADVLREEGRYERVIRFFGNHGYKVVAVAYMRDQPGWLNSWYTQDQRNFVSRQTFGEFLDHAIEIGLVDPQAYLGRFIADPRVEVRVVAFEQAVKQGLVKSFLATIGAPADFEIPEPRASNPNLGVKGVWAAQEIMRRVDIRIRSLPNYSELYDRFRALMRGRNWEETAYIGVSPENEKRIRDHYRASNDAFARQWFGRDWATVCPPKPMTRREFDFEAASETDKSDVLEVVEEMVRLIESGPAPKRKASGDGAKPGKGKKFGQAGATGDGPKKGDGKKGKGKKGKGKKAGAGKGPKKADKPEAAGAA